jgi:hypothetical protein
MQSGSDRARGSLEASQEDLTTRPCGGEAEAAHPGVKLVRKTALRKILRLSSGFGLVIIGIIGLILPVMPGWVFLIPGLLILSEYFPPLKRVLDWAKKKALDVTRSHREG